MPDGTQGERARAAVLREVGRPMAVEEIMVGPLRPGDVLVRVAAASLCHTDLEVIEGQLALRLPAVLGHEAAGSIAALGEGVAGLSVGDPVVLSWNPHCGHCFYCEGAQPILCEQYLANGPKAVHFDGSPRLRCDDGSTLHQFWAYVQQTASLNFGRSYLTNEPVMSEILDAAPATIWLVGVSAILSAVIFNALVIVALIPLALRGVRFRPGGAAATLRRNLLVYGLGGLVAPFVGIKAIDLVVNALGGL